MLSFVLEWQDDASQEGEWRGVVCREGQGQEEGEFAKRRSRVPGMHELEARVGCGEIEGCREGHGKFPILRSAFGKLTRPAVLSRSSDSAAGDWGRKQSTEEGEEAFDTS